VVLAPAAIKRDGVMPAALARCAMVRPTFFAAAMFPPFFKSPRTSADVVPAATSVLPA
jgi:hypothetical protein